MEEALAATDLKPEAAKTLLKWDEVRAAVF